MMLGELDSNTLTVTANLSNSEYNEGLIAVMLDSRLLSPPWLVHEVGCTRLWNNAKRVTT